MFNKIFYTRTRVIFLFLFLVSFFGFRYVPGRLSLKSDMILLLALVSLLTIWFVNNNKIRNVKTVFNKRLNILLTLLFFSALANCLSSYIFRGQDVWVTFYQWSPIFLLFLFYPLKSLNFTVKSWETILISLFCIEMSAEIIQYLFPQMLLFDMTSGNDKFLREFRCRIFGNGIISVGSLFCLNYALTYKSNTFIYWILYFISIVLMFLSGFRVVLLGMAVSSIFLALRIKQARLRTIIGSVILVLGIYGFLQMQISQERIKELVNRQENHNFDNDDYVRIVTLNYYLHNHFKSPTEAFWGSGLVNRRVDPSTHDIYKVKFESDYSHEISLLAARYHIYTVDWGLLGFSWEGGIPAALVLVLIAVLLVCVKTDERFLYISSFGVFALINSLTSARYHGYNNLVWTVLLLVIANKLYQLDKVKKIFSMYTDC